MENKPRRILAAPYDTPMLEWWGSDYDHVFIVLSPFFRVEGYTPETAAFGPIHSDLQNFDDIMDLIKHPVDRPNEAPEGFEGIIKQCGEPILWHDIQSAIGVDDFLTFCRAAWLWTVASPRVKEYSEVVEKLEVYCQENGIYKPEEDQMPLVLESLIGRYLSALGIGEVTIFNEFRNKQISMPVTAFSQSQPVVQIPSEKTNAIVSLDPKVMFTWGFDDTYGFICITEETRLVADPADFFEGLYAGINTYSDWLNPADFFDRKKARGKN